MLGPQLCVRVGGLPRRACNCVSAGALPVHGHVRTALPTGGKKPTASSSVPQVARILLDRGANANAESRLGQLPIHIAADNLPDCSGEAATAKETRPASSRSGDATNAAKFISLLAARRWAR